jgi:hypothetical protein
MLIVYRIFWIVGLIALVAEMVILANPRQVAPQKRVGLGDTGAGSVPRARAEATAAGA